MQCADTTSDSKKETNGGPSMFFVWEYVPHLDPASYYNAFNFYCRELGPGTVSLTGDRAQGDDSI